MKEEPITTVRKTVHLTTDSIKALEKKQPETERTYPKKNVMPLRLYKALQIF